MNNFKFLIIVAIATFNITGCCKSKIEQALQLAGDNRHVLEMVLEHYKNSREKYAAAQFLIENMPGKMSVKYKAIDYKGEIGRLDTLDIANLQQLKHWIFLIEDSSSDLESISAELLIENIDLAFEARSRYPWCAALSFDEFCRSVLPYRIKQEPLESWRRYYLNRYGALVDSLAKTSNSLHDVVFFLNKRLGKQYIQAADRVVGDMSFQVIEHLGGGTCDHLALNAVQIMRTFGIPLNLDILPYHGKVNGGHVYNSFTDEKGVFHFFSPYEREPQKHKWVAPLILRVNYEIQSKTDKPNKYNRLINSSILTNVTNKYFKIQDIELPIEMPDESQIYLAVFNRGRLNTVHQSRSEAGKVLFLNVTCGLLYFPTTDRNNTLTPCGDPFIINETGGINQITPTNNAVVIDSIHLYDVRRKLTLKNYNYRLWAWKNGWIEVAKTTSCDFSTLNFGKIDINTLFLISGNEDIEQMQRPFILSEKEYEFW